MYADASGLLEWALTNGPGVRTDAGDALDPFRQKRRLAIATLPQLACTTDSKAWAGTRLAEDIALELVASSLTQESELLGRLHALSRDGEVEAVGHSDDGAGDGGVARIDE
jgi:hypothetical protein